MVTVYLFAGLWFVVLVVPCAGIIWIGWNMLNRIGRYPSKMPFIQLGIILKLVIVEVISVTLILLFFRIFM